MEKIINAISDAATNQGGKQQEIDLHNVLSECVTKGDFPGELFNQIEEYVKKTA
ncbi:TPA: hypothetical protein ROY11_004509 [Bacillus cereus]|nr:hypothetical protein [Bacillus cereus]